MASVCSITPTSFHYRIVYIAAEELCSIGVVFRCLVGHLQQLCKCLSFFHWLPPVRCFLWQTSVGWALNRRRCFGTVGPFRGWQPHWEKQLMARSSQRRHFVFASSWEHRAFFTPQCTLRGNTGSALSETLQRGWGSFVRAQIIFYYNKTESNSLPSQLAAVVL